jgi:hypothetical protein
MIDNDTEIQLPRNAAALNEFFDTIIGAAQVPDNDLFRELIATVIGQSDASKVWFPVSYFVDRIQHIQAHSVAYEYIQSQREKAKKAAQEEFNKQADTKTEVSVDVGNNKDS